MLRIGLAFLIGHCVIHLLPELPAATPWAWVLCALMVLALLTRLRLAVAVLVGMALAWSSAALRLADDLPSGLEGVDLQVRGYVASLIDTQGADPQFELDVTGAAAGVPARIRLAWYQAPEQPQPGELWQVMVRLKRRSGFANPGGFDYEAQLLHKEIGATGYVRDDAGNRRLASPAGRYAVLRVRAWLASRIATAVDQDPMRGILQGLAVGETGAMSADQWRVFSATGTTHLMAISGLHITMIAALAAGLGRQIVRWAGAQRRELTAIHGEVACGAGAAIAYSLLAGMSVPTQRTLLMLCIVFLVRASHREFSTGNALGLAIIAVLLIDPLAPMAVGAWLSFGAVAVILLALAGRRGREGIVRTFTRTQTAVTIGLMPVLLAAFGSVSLVSPLANAFAVPLFTIVLVPLVLLGTLAASASIAAGSLILALPTAILHWCWPLFEWLAGLPVAQWHFPQLPLVVHAALVLGTLLLVLPGIAASRIAAVALCLPALVWRPAALPPNAFRVTALDVGQGLATVIQTRSHVMVYDAGPAFRSGRDTGELVVVPYLRSQGIRSLDMLMISHGDADHRGGMESVLKSLPVLQLMTGPSVQPVAHPRAARCRRGESWVWDGVQFALLHPATGSHDNDNDSSCVLRIEGEGGTALLTGDIQRDAEQMLVAQGLDRADIVIAPHHGSNTSSTEPFVAATDPDFVVFSAGYRNRWGFPKPQVIERWRSRGTQILSTADSGAIAIEVTATQACTPQRFRRQYPRYWRSR